MWCALAPSAMPSSTKTGSHATTIGMRRKSARLPRAAGRPTAGGEEDLPRAASLATRWMAPRPRSDDSAPFYRCVMRRKSLGHFWRITQQPSFDRRRFPIVRPQLGGRLRCSHRGGDDSWRAGGDSEARAPVFESNVLLHAARRAGFSRRRGSSDWSKVHFDRDKARTVISRRRCQLIGERRRSPKRPYFLHGFSAIVVDVACPDAGTG